MLNMYEYTFNIEAQKGINLNIVVLHIYNYTN